MVGGVLLLTFLAQAPEVSKVELVATSSPTSAPEISQSHPKDRAAPAAERELELLRDVLGTRAEAQRSARTAMALSGLAVGAVAIPTGIYLIGELPEQTLPFVVLGLGIGAVLGSALSLLLVPPESAEAIVETLEARAAQGASAEENVEKTLTAWREAAESLHTQRRVLAILLPMLGAVSLGAGVATAIAGANEGGSTRDGLLAISTVTFAGGMVFGIAGFQVGFVELPEEWAYHEYMKVRRVDLPPRSELKAAEISFGISPLPGGATVSLGATF